MNYETIILELLSRVQKLETDVVMMKDLAKKSDSSVSATMNDQTYIEGAKKSDSSVSATMNDQTYIEGAKKSDNPASAIMNGQTYTAVARNYIIEQKRAAKQRGEDRIMLRAGDIEKAIGLKNRPVIVCNAMKQLMSGSDRIVEAPPSGFSTTVKIEYFL